MTRLSKRNPQDKSGARGYEDGAFDDSRRGSTKRCKIVCLIVCPTACRNCDITPCEDRMADENTEEKVTVASAEMDEFWTGRKGGKGTIIPNIYEDKIIDIKEVEGLKHCGMRSDLICRSCHDSTCKIRLAPRTA